MNRRNYKKFQDDQNASLVSLGIFSHKCGNLFVLKLTTKDIPFPSAFVFDKNKKQIGKIEEIFGPQNEVYAAITSENELSEYFILSNKLIAKNRFLERTETEKKKEAEDKRGKKGENKREVTKKFDNKRGKKFDNKRGKKFENKRGKKFDNNNRRKFQNKK